MEESPRPDGPDAERQPSLESRQLPANAPPADRYAALRADFAGLQEVCRWQWHLIQRLQQHLDKLPKRWPDDGPAGR